MISRPQMCRFGPPWRRRLRRVISAAGAALALTTLARADAVDDIVAKELVRQKIPGAAIAVVHGGKLVKTGAYGMADTERRTPVAVNTIFRLQSLTKPFTAAAVMLLAEDGKLGLDDAVSRHLDGCPETWRAMTIRHLLAHTSGLKDFVNDSSGALNLQGPVTEAELFAWAARQPLKFGPGDAWDYSNTNYLLLGRVIARVGGLWHGDFLAARIFGPLGMTRTTVPRDAAASADLARGYTLVRGKLRPGAILAPAVASYAGGGAQSTVLDLVRWDAALRDERLLKRAAREQLWTPVKLNNGTTHDYGLGWEIDATPAHRRVWHEGRWTGFSARMDRWLDDDLTVIVLTNLAEASPGRLGRAIAETYLPALAKPVYQPVPDREPAVTARLLDVLRRTREGGLRADEFVEPVWAYIEPRREQLQRDFGAFGAIQTLTLVERTDEGENRSYRYRAKFGRTTLLFHFVLTPDHRIAVMMPEQVGQ